MTTLEDLQESVRDRSAFENIDDYVTICLAFLALIEEIKPTRIVSPRENHYFFYQYSERYSHSITRPLNGNLFIETPTAFQESVDRFLSFLDDLRKYEHSVVDRRGTQEYIQSGQINKVVYTIQQSIGSISDSFADSNQSRKRVGQLFENLIKLIITHIGVQCESRSIRVPIPNFPGYNMSYQLDLVFSRNSVLLTSESELIQPSEVIGSVKTTSKDRIDKIFLDKFMLTRLIGRDIPVIAIFLHDVQRARRGESIFGINSTFKTNHFLCYTVALNRLDGVYYVDPRPNMTTDHRLSPDSTLGEIQLL